MKVRLALLTISAQTHGAALPPFTCSFPQHSCWYAALHPYANGQVKCPQKCFIQQKRKGTADQQTLPTSLPTSGSCEGEQFKMYSYHLNPSPKVEAACESTWSKIHLERHSINLYPELADFTDTEWSIKRQSMHNTQI
ncbi:hypothetical protein Anapl_14087 [Anas platyrhynchos]|uniref:Uncharacterized protein n=1 Tax=Anas platyrhynchos TaxID=8839 RepID=R0JY96_ANAPL|nr:hypothetical protein Anapl_14087 [Anas platyrhynchos]